MTMFLGASGGTALGATDAILAPSETTFAGGSGPGGEFLLDAGSRPTLVNTDDNADHNVVSTSDGPDGRPLFKTALLDPYASAPVEGTEYLTPGTYQFVCSIHAGMVGALRVEGTGALPRPEVEVTVLSKKVEKVAKGKLFVRVDAAVAATGVELIARRGLRPLSEAGPIDLATGESRRVVLRLDRAARKLLREVDSAKVTVAADVPYGAPDTAKTKLR